MATIDRIEPAYSPWSPSTSGFVTASNEDYVGRHRRPSMRGLGLMRMLHRARHRMPGTR